MAEKVKVTVEVDPTQTTVIKPFGEQLSEKAETLGDSTNPTGTVSNVSGTPDVDVDVEF